MGLICSKEDLGQMLGKTLATRVVALWNRLPREVEESLLFEVFNNRFGKHLSEIVQVYLVLCQHRGLDLMTFLKGVNISTISKAFSVVRNIRCRACTSKNIRRTALLLFLQYLITAVLKSHALFPAKCLFNFQSLVLNIQTGFSANMYDTKIYCIKAQ